jgi:hypothetical protein
LLRRNITLNGMKGRDSVEEVTLAGPASGRVLRLVVSEDSRMNAHLLPGELTTRPTG